MHRPPVLALIVGIFTASAAAHAACPDSSTSSELLMVLEQAEAAYLARDKEAVVAQAEQASQVLACVREELNPGLVAHYHRVQGLRFFLEKDDPAAREAFAAARAIEPAYRLPAWLAPEGNPLHATYDAIALSNGTFEPAPAPTQGWELLLDGRQQDLRPTAWPTVLQLLDEAGAVRATLWIPPDSPIPPEVLALLGVPVEPAEAIEGHDSVAETVIPHSAAPSRGLLWGAAGAAVASGTLYALSYKAHQDYWESTDPDTADARYRLNHGLVIGSAAAGAVALGLGVGFAFTVQF